MPDTTVGRLKRVGSSRDVDCQTTGLHQQVFEGLVSVSGGGVAFPVEVDVAVSGIDRNRGAVAMIETV